jgi:hypothetical protein
MKNLFFLIIFITLTTNLRSQSGDCVKDFDFLVQKIKIDYPGYNEKVTAKTNQDLHKLEQELRNRIQRYPDSCGKYLSIYASWFKDNHLRIRRLNYSSVSNNNDKSIPKMYSGNLDSIIFSGSDPVEGHWHSFGGDIAIIKSQTNNEFIGIAVSFRKYKKNQIVFTLSKIANNEYDVISSPYYNSIKPKNGKASLRLDEKIIELHDDTRFVRKTNSPISDEALLYSYFPEYPNGNNIFPLATKLSDSTFYLRITSFEDDEAELAVRKHWSEITSMPYLIIDIRGNGGGQDNFYQVLADLIYTNPYESKGVEWYATENNIKMYENAIKDGKIKDGEEGIRRTTALLNEMKKNIGGFVIHPLTENDETVKNDTVYPSPKKVGIIIDDGNASSAEQFLLDAKESTKVLLFGNCNTAGVLDYSNAITEKLPSNKYELFFPMTRSRRLPNHPIDNIGISPDVNIPYPRTHQLFDRLDQWVYFVKDYLELSNKMK